MVCMQYNRKIINFKNNSQYIQHLARYWSTAVLSDSSVFTTLHELQTRSTDENSVRPSVRQTCGL